VSGGQPVEAAVDARGTDFIEFLLETQDCFGPHTRADDRRPLRDDCGLSKNPSAHHCQYRQDQQQAESHRLDVPALQVLSVCMADCP
jgi:hypothetical protein